ncbi:MAG: tetratricopeptide repeat protein [Dehalococcoidia bacterium]
MTNQTQDKARNRRQQLAKQAIEFAMQSRWEDAIATNRTIIASFPDEQGAFNRLGKALTETGKIKEAREAYQRALELDPSNAIAKKNLDRLSQMKGKTEPDKAQQVDTSLFIEEMGKTGVTSLRPQSMKLLTTLSAGDEVALKPVGNRLTVETMAGDYVSDVEPKLALRLTKLMDGGNKYAAAVAGVTPDNVRVIIKETFQHPTQVGRLSFPAGKAGDVIRPHIRESMVRTDAEDDDDAGDETEDWDDSEEETTEAPRDVSLFDASREEDSDDSDFDE